MKKIIKWLRDNLDIYLYEYYGIKKVEKLVNKKGYIPVLSGNEIVFIYNKLTGKEYTPKYSLMIGGEL